MRLRRKQYRAKGLYAEGWVKEQSKHPSGVIRLDMGHLTAYYNKEELNNSVIKYLVRYYMEKYNLNISLENKNAGDLFLDIIGALYKQFGSVVVLIDEYDKPMTDNIDNLEKANEMRGFLRSFYGLLKDLDEVKFIFITGVSKFSKVGVFSGLNNLKDISMIKEYGDIVGYTQKELEDNFSEWIEETSNELKTTKEKLLKMIKKHYDGFSFDGIVRLYNPFSILNFLQDKRFDNYWYDSATPSFLAKYFKTHKINDSDAYRHLKVKSNFTKVSEIEHASPESFLFQTGYLTIEKWDYKRNIITLDYPNEEVKESFPQLYLFNIYNITDYITLAEEIWNYLKNGNIENVVDVFNGMLARIPYDDFVNEKIDTNLFNSEQQKKLEDLMYSKKEKWYRSLFIMLISSLKIQSFPETHTNKGRPDIVIPFRKQIVIIEFKLAKKSKDVPAKKKEGEEQIKKYLPAYEGKNKKIITAVFVADDEKRQVIF